MKEIKTVRLILREWQDEDVPLFAEINQDPKVMEHFPSLRTLQETKDMVSALRQQSKENGFTFWAVELISSGEFIGFIGLSRVTSDLPFGPAVEIGWRLSSKHWGHGYAPEGAKAALDYGFKNLHLEEIVSFTVPANENSIRVMEKIGMHRDLNGDFPHPKIPKGHQLSKHVLYRIKKAKFKGAE